MLKPHVTIYISVLLLYTFQTNLIIEYCKIRFIVNHIRTQYILLDPKLLKNKIARGCMCLCSPRDHGVLRSPEVVLGLVDVRVADPTVEHLHHHIFRACAPVVVVVVVVVTTTHSHMRRDEC